MRSRSTPISGKAAQLSAEASSARAANLGPPRRLAVSLYSATAVSCVDSHGGSRLVHDILRPEYVSDLSAFPASGGEYLRPCGPPRIDRR